MILIAKPVDLGGDWSLFSCATNCRTFYFDMLNEFNVQLIQIVTISPFTIPLGKGLKFRPIRSQETVLSRI